MYKYKYTCKDCGYEFKSSSLIVCPKCKSFNITLKKDILNSPELLEEWMLKFWIKVDLKCKDCGHKFRFYKLKNCPKCGSFYIRPINKKKFNSNPKLKKQLEDWKLEDDNMKFINNWREY